MMIGCLVVGLKAGSLGLGLPATIEARQHDPGGVDPEESWLKERAGELQEKLFLRKQKAESSFLESSGCDANDVLITSLSAP